MAEVHLSLADRERLSAILSRYTCDDCPPTIRAGSWKRLLDGELWAIDLREALDLMDLFPKVRKVLTNGKVTAPDPVRDASYFNDTGLRERTDDPSPWDKERW